MTAKGAFPKEVQKAQEKLQPGEEMLEWTNGLCESQMLGAVTKRNGILIATDRRVVIYVSKMFGAYDLEEYPYGTMSSIEISKGWMGHAATFIAASNRTRVTMMSQGNPVRFVEVVRSRIGVAPAVAEAPVSTAIDGPSMIRQLAQLHAEGLLTDQEFSAKKAEILARM